MLESESEDEESELEDESESEVSLSECWTGFIAAERVFCGLDCNAMCLGFFREEEPSESQGQTQSLRAERQLTVVQSLALRAWSCARLYTREPRL